ncbi:MAG: hypothetical protein ISN29_01990 [Gammaproteobacteria bacterium AqS3]|nr:hypothetical protein [Gammaproteobacteria bacterium AqS3]
MAIETVEVGSFATIRRIKHIPSAEERAMNKYRDAFRQVKAVVDNAVDAADAVKRLSALDRLSATNDGTRLSADEISDLACDLIILAYQIMSQIDEDDLNEFQEEALDRIERAHWNLKED